MDKHSFGSDQQSCCEKLFVVVRSASPFLRPMHFTKQQHHKDAAKHTTASSTTVSLMTPTPPKDRCVRVPKAGTVATETSPNGSLATTNLNDRCPRVSKQSVRPPAADTKTQSGAVAVTHDHKGNHSHVSSTTVNQVKPKATHSQVPATTVNQAKPKATHSQVPATTVNQVKPKVTTLPIHGHENRIPTDVGGSKTFIAQSINGMSSEYIERTGKKIRSPTNVGAQKPSIARDSFNDRVNDFINRTKNKFHNAPSFTDGLEGKENRLK